VLGQLLTLVLIGLVLKFLTTKSPLETSWLSYHPRLPRDQHFFECELESAGWLDGVLEEVTYVYRSQFRDGLEGSAGDEIARGRLEDIANKVRPSESIDHVTIHSIDLGVSAPRVSNASRQYSHFNGPFSFDLVYADNLQVTFSSSYKLGYPIFDRIPISGTISLSFLHASIHVSPPPSGRQMVTISISPNFILKLSTVIRVLGVEISDYPKLDDLLQRQVQKVLAEATWGFSLIPDSHHVFIHNNLRL